MQSPNACLIIIGNEILSGRTQDKNLAWLAEKLNAEGVRLLEVRVIPDIEETIVHTVNECRSKFTYIFTTGGIGPTHDDITTASVAKAFGKKVIRHPEAEAALRKNYTPEQINAARLKMADVPEGARLIPNSVTAAPGFCIENVYVFAGIPKIMQAMFDAMKHELKGGAPMLSRSFSAFITEGTLAEELTTIQNRFPEIEVGSYPFARDGKLGTTLVARGIDEAKLNAAAEEINKLLGKYASEVVED